MIKLLIGGSPCTYWSIAQTKNRETQASGLGWELFKNYLIAKEKFQPDFFLYENNVSASKEIKEQIKNAFGVWDGSLLTKDTGARYIEINSALVSAQTRKRFYCHNCGDVQQPKDRGIMLRDILEVNCDLKDVESLKVHEGTKKGYAEIEVGECVDLERPNSINRRGRKMANKTNCLLTQGVFYQYCGTVDKHTGNVDLEGVEIGKVVQKSFDKAVEKYGEIPLIFNPYHCKEITGKAPTLTTRGDSSTVSATVLLPQPINTVDGKSHTITASYYKMGENPFSTFDSERGRQRIAEPVRVGALPRPNGELSTSQAFRVYGDDGKSITLSANGGGAGGKTGLYAIPVKDNEQYLSEKMLNYAFKEGTKNFHQRVKFMEDKGCPLTTEQNKRAGTTNYIPQNIGGIEYVLTDDGNAKGAKPVYKVTDGKMTVKGKEYPIKLKDGYYIIRKLTVNECCRLQTMPDNYCRAVSNTQAYKGLGNGWTAEVIIHILWNALKDVPKDEPIKVLSLYDGIGTGRYCLDKMGFTNVEYHAYEIDKYAMEIAKSNYPDIIYHGDAFQVRNEEWKI